MPSFVDAADAAAGDSAAQGSSVFVGRRYGRCGQSLRALLGTMTLQRPSPLLHPHRQTVADAESV